MAPLPVSSGPSKTLGKLDLLCRVFKRALRHENWPATFCGKVDTSDKAVEPTREQANAVMLSAHSFAIWWRHSTLDKVNFPVVTREHPQHLGNMTF